MLRALERWCWFALLCAAVLTSGARARAADTDPEAMPPDLPLVKASPETFEAAIKEPGEGCRRRGHARHVG